VTSAYFVRYFCSKTAKGNSRGWLDWEESWAAKRGSMSEEDKKPALRDEKVIGNGSFGVVFQATMVETGEIVAVKKVLQDKRFKVRSCCSVSVGCHARLLAPHARTYTYHTSAVPGNAGTHVSCFECSLHAFAFTE